MLRLAEFTDDTWEPYKPIQTLTSSTPNGLPGVPVSSDGNCTDASGQQWVCDEVDYDRGVYVQRCGKITFDGTENWNWSSGNINEYPHIPIVSSYGYRPGKNRDSYSDNFIVSHGLVSSEGWTLASATGNFSDAAIYIMQIGYAAPIGTFGSKEAWKAYVSDEYDAGRPITVIYELEKPIEKPLSADEINAYKALQTYKPNTTIHNSENAHMAVDYVADTKTYIDNKIASEVAKLSAAIITE